MTVEEKRRALDSYCNKRGGCSATFDDKVCPLYVESDCLCKYIKESSDENVEHCYDLVFGGVEEPTEPVEQPHDVVNHPSHYCQGGMECIDEMILLFGKEVVKHFCLCNAWKYRKRAMFKNGQEDMDKSDWYIKKYKGLSEDV